MLTRALSFLFPCRHKRLSRPMKQRNCPEMYVVCLDCGKRLGYDWQRGQVLWRAAGK